MYGVFAPIGATRTAVDGGPWTLVSAAPKVTNVEGAQLQIDAAGHTAVWDHCCDGGKWKVGFSWSIPQTLVAGKPAAITLGIKVDESTAAPNGYSLGAFAPDFKQAFRYTAQGPAAVPLQSKTFSYTLGQGYASDPNYDDIAITIGFVSSSVTYTYHRGVPAARGVHFKVDTHANDVRVGHPLVGWWQLCLSKLNGSGNLHSNHKLINGGKLFQENHCPTHRGGPRDLDASVMWQVTRGTITTKKVELNFGTHEPWEMKTLTLRAKVFSTFDRKLCPVGWKATIILVEDRRRLGNGWQMDNAHIDPTAASARVRRRAGRTPTTRTTTRRTAASAAVSTPRSTSTRTRRTRRRGPAVEHCGAVKRLAVLALALAVARRSRRVRHRQTTPFGHTYQTTVKGQPAPLNGVWLIAFTQGRLHGHEEAVEARPDRRHRQGPGNKIVFHDAGGPLAARAARRPAPTAGRLRQEADAEDPEGPVPRPAADPRRRAVHKGGLSPGSSSPPPRRSCVCGRPRRTAGFGADGHGDARPGCGRARAAHAGRAALPARRASPRSRRSTRCRTTRCSRTRSTTRRSGSRRCSRSSAASSGTGPPTRWPWLLFAAGQLLFVAGDVLFGYYEHVAGTTPFPSPADALYLLGLPRARRRPLAARPPALDPDGLDEPDRRGDRHRRARDRGVGAADRPLHPRRLALARREARLDRLPARRRAPARGRGAAAVRHGACGRSRTS